MDYKLEYMERLFANISKKKTESYVISRIWHLLDDDRVKFVVQQYIRRTQDKYALADLYLPQLNIFIEINEPFHKNNVEVDKVRNEEILNITHSKPIVIDCDNDIQEIHRQVADVVKLIKQRISELGDRHESQAPWLPARFGCCRSQQKARNSLVAEHGTPSLAQRTFGGWNGYLRISESGGQTCGTSETMAFRSRRNKNNIPAVQRYKDDLGFCFYRFVGVFHLNREKSVQENKCVWERVSNTYKL